MTEPDSHKNMNVGRGHGVPSVSVVVPVYNEAHVLSECLEALLRQTYPQERYEVVVVDNGSTDGTRSVIESYPVRSLVEDEIQSSYAARNAGIRAARGEILAFTDADCRPALDWLGAAVENFRDPEVGGVAGRIVGGPPQSKVEAELKRRSWQAETATLQHDFLPYAQTANAFYRRTVFEAVGDFEETWISGGDADLAWRMQLETSMRLAHEPAAVVEHRHRSDLAAVFRQSIKWGLGSAQLERRYGRQAVPPDLRSVRQTALYLGRVTAGYLRRIVLDLLRESSSAYSSTPLVCLAARGGRQLGLVYGRRLPQVEQPVAGW